MGMLCKLITGEKWPWNWKTTVIREQRRGKKTLKQKTACEEAKEEEWKVGSDSDGAEASDWQLLMQWLAGNEWSHTPDAPGQVGGRKSISGDTVKWERKIGTVIQITHTLTTHVGSQMLTHSHTGYSCMLQDTPAHFSVMSAWNNGHPRFLPPLPLTCTYLRSWP